MGPRLRQRTTKALYAYLQYHAPRYFGGHFAGALAHRISENGDERQSHGMVGVVRFLAYSGDLRRIYRAVY